MDELETVIRRIVRDEIEAALAAMPAPVQELAEPVNPLSLYPVSKVAEMLGTGTDYVYSRIKWGEIPVVELGDGRAKQRVRASDLDKFISGRSST